VLPRQLVAKTHLPVSVVAQHAAKLSEVTYLCPDAQLTADAIIQATLLFTHSHNYAKIFCFCFFLFSLDLWIVKITNSLLHQYTIPENSSP
jgi:hypothetical protein